MRGPLLSLVLLAPACVSSWSPEGAIAPTLALLDEKGDGKVDAMDWDRVSPSEPTLETVDQDHDKAISNQEMLLLLLAHDPLRYEPHPLARAGAQRPQNAPEPEYFHPGSWDDRMIKELLLFVRAELVAVNPKLALPPREQIERLAHVENLDEPQQRAMIHELMIACSQEHLPFHPLLESLHSTRTSP